MYRSDSFHPGLSCHICRPYNKHGRGPLYIAAERGHRRIAGFFLLLGHSPDEPDSYGITPLQIAAWNGHCNVVKRLVEHSVNVNLSDRVGHSALFKAVWKGCKNCVECLIQAGAQPNLKDKLGETPLMLAAEIGCVQVVPTLLKAGALPDTQNLRTETAIYIATTHGNTECARLLIQAGANPDIKNCDGNTPMFCAVSRKLSMGALEIMKILIWGNASLEIKGRDMNILNGRPLTPFEYAIHANHLLGAWLLVEAGCDVSSVLYWAEADEIPNSLLDNVEFHEYLKEWVVTPPAMIRICRKVVRSNMKSLEDIPKLKLPATLIDFLCFAELDEIG